MLATSNIQRVGPQLKNNLASIQPGYCRGPLANKAQFNLAHHRAITDKYLYNYGVIVKTTIITVPRKGEANGETIANKVAAQLRTQMWTLSDRGICRV